MKKFTNILLGLIMLSLLLSGCGTNEKSTDLSLWNFADFVNVKPVVQETSLTYGSYTNIKGIYFEGAEYLGEKTSIFAYIGLPTTEKPEGGYPAIVLVHGGLGRAFPDWVKKWTDRGYAAIALSVDANKSLTQDGIDSVHNNKGGPNISIKPTDFTDPKNSWQYISVANIIFANNILRNNADINSEKIGITGISWGSYLTVLTSGVDSRFAFGIPVYGAGFMVEDVSSQLASVFAFTDEETKTYNSLWDPSVYAKKSNMPMFWVSGVNDFAFATPCVQKTADLTKGKNYFAWRNNLTHGQQPGDGTGLEEIFAFADMIVKGKNDMTVVGEEKVVNNIFTAKITNQVDAYDVKFYWAETILETFRDALWVQENVTIDGKTLSATVPENAFYGFMQISDKNGNIISTRLMSF